MTPKQAIAMLDRQLGSHGSTFTLVRKQIGGADIEWAAKGFMRDLKSSETTDGIGQGARKLALSPTYLIGSAFAVEPPKRGDMVFVQGRRMSVQACEPVLVADVAVRFNLTVTG